LLALPKVMVEPQLGVRLVDDRDRPRAPQDRGVLLTLGVAHQVARGVLEVGDQVRESRSRLSHHPTDGVEVPAADVHRHRHVPGPGAAERGVGVGVARRLHEHALARADQCLGHDHQSRQRARHDQDLVRRRRQTARDVRLCDRLLQRGQAGREVAVPAEVERQVLHGVGVRRGDAGRRGRRGTAQVDHVVVADVGGQGSVERLASPAGDPRVGARSLPGHREPALDQRGVGPGDGGARDAERDAQVALAREPEVDVDAPVPDQQAELVGEPGVRRVAVEVAREGREPGGGNGSRHAVHCLTIGY
jgi:hypothetical protein